MIKLYLFSSGQLQEASNPSIDKIEHWLYVWFGSAASHPKNPVPEFVTITPPFPILGIYTELLIKFK